MKEGVLCWVGCLWVVDVCVGYLRRLLGDCVECNVGRGW